MGLTTLLSMNEFTRAELEEMAAETGMTLEEVRRVIAENDGLGTDDQEDAYARDPQAVTGPLRGIQRHHSVQILPLRPASALREICRRLEQELGVESRRIDDASAELFDHEHGVRYHVLAERDDEYNSRVTVSLDPTPARARTMISRSGALTNAVVGGVLMLAFSFPPLLTAFTGAMVGTSFWFASRTRDRARRGLDMGRAVVASALLGMEDRLALPPAE